MKRRIFVALVLPDSLKLKIADAITQLRWLPIRWLKPENWHITLIPPVYLEDGEVQLLYDFLKRRKLGRSFAIRFSRIILAPPGTRARIIWLEGETLPELAKLKKKIENLWLANESLPKIEVEPRPIKLHVTLARFEPGDLREIEEKTKVLGEVKLKFEASEIALMESFLRPEGAEYKVISVISLS